TAEFVTIGKRALAVGFVGMMPRNGQVGDEERPVAAALVDPPQEAVDRRRLVDAEARLLLAADVPGIRERRESSIANDRVHAQVVEPPRVEERRAIALIGKRL